MLHFEIRSAKGLICRIDRLKVRISPKRETTFGEAKRVYENPSEKILKAFFSTIFKYFFLSVSVYSYSYSLAYLPLFYVFSFVLTFRDNFQSFLDLNPFQPFRPQPTFSIWTAEAKLNKVFQNLESNFGIKFSVENSK